MATTDTAPENLTPDQWQAMLAASGTAAPAPRPALAPLGAAPQPAAPTAAPALPVVNPGIPALAQPTPQQSRTAGKAEYQAGLPKVTATPYTPEWAQQQEELAQYKHLHPLGGDVSAMPGPGGKFLHGLGRVANVAGDILAPGIALNVPGSDMYNRGQNKLFQKEFTAGRENEQRQADTNRVNTESELIPWTSPTGDTNQVMRSEWAPLEAGKEREAAESERVAGQEAAHKAEEESREKAEETGRQETIAGENKRTGEELENRKALTGEEIASREKTTGQEIGSREKIAQEEIAGREKVAQEGRQAEQRDKDLAAVEKDKEAKWLEVQQKYAGIAGTNWGGKLHPDQQRMMEQELQQVQNAYEGQLGRYGQNVTHYDVAGGANTAGDTVKMRAPNGDERDVPRDQVGHYASLGAIPVPPKPKK